MKGRAVGNSDALGGAQTRLFTAAESFRALGTAADQAGADWPPRPTAQPPAQHRPHHDCEPGLNPVAPDF